MKRRLTTAQELLDSLQQDPESTARQRERRARFAEFRATLAADEQELVRDVRAQGYDISSIWDLVNNEPGPDLARGFVGSYEHAYPVLVRHLQLRHHPRTREGIVRALTVKDGGRLVEDALLKGFESETDERLRWVFANALTVAMRYRRRTRHPEIKAAFRSDGDA